MFTIVWHKDYGWFFMEYTEAMRFFRERLKPAGYVKLKYGDAGSGIYTPNRDRLMGEIDGSEYVVFNPSMKEFLNDKDRELVWSTSKQSDLDKLLKGQ